LAVEKVTVKEALQRASFRYREAGLEQPREEAEILLAHLLGWDRLRLYLEGERELPPEAVAAFQEAQERRSRGEPLAYITGKKEFYGLEFKVTPAVLIPRPETEFLVDAVLEWVGKRGAPRGEGLVLGDLGTGSGNLVVTLSCLLPLARCWAIDISPEALQVARENAARHKVEHRICWRRGDYFKALEKDQPPPRFDVIVSNPPYIPGDALDCLPQTVRGYEPLLALDGGGDGLEGYRRLLEDLPRHLRSPGLVVLEVGDGQMEAVERLCRERGIFKSLAFRQDYAGRARVLEGLV